MRHSHLVMLVVSMLGGFLPVCPASVEGGWLFGPVRKVMMEKSAAAAARRQVAQKKAAALKAVRQQQQGKRTASETQQAIREWDLARDKTLPVRPMRRTTTVSRYTTKKEAKQAMTNGIAPNTHLTSAPVGPGRPLSREAARKRYGLARTPDARIVVTVPKGQPVRKGKVIAGSPGFGELTSPQWIPPQHIGKVAPLKAHGAAGR